MYTPTYDPCDRGAEIMACHIVPPFYKRTHNLNCDRKTIEDAIKASRTNEQEFYPRYDEQNLAAPPPYSEVHNKDWHTKEAALHKARDHIKKLTRELQRDIIIQQAFVEALVVHIATRQGKLAIVNELDVAVLDLIAELESDLPPVQQFLDGLPNKYKVENDRRWRLEESMESKRRCIRIEEAIRRRIPAEEILHTSFEDWIIETQKPAPEVILARSDDVTKAASLTAPTTEDIAAALAARKGLPYGEISGWGNLYSAPTVDRIKAYLVEAGNANLRTHLEKLWTQRGRFHLTDAYKEDFESRVARLKCIQIRIAELTAGDGDDAEMARQEHAQRGISVHLFVAAGLGATTGYFT